MPWKFREAIVYRTGASPSTKEKCLMFYTEVLCVCCLHSESLRQMSHNAKYIVPYCLVDKEKNKTAGRSKDSRNTCPSSQVFICAAICCIVQRINDVAIADRFWKLFVLVRRLFVLWCHWWSELSRTETKEGRFGCADCHGSRYIDNHIQLIENQDWTLLILSIDDNKIRSIQHALQYVS